MFAGSTHTVNSIPMGRVFFSNSFYIKHSNKPFLGTPSRILCNGVQREAAKLSLGLAWELFCYVPLHKIRYGVRMLNSCGLQSEATTLRGETHPPRVLSPAEVRKTAN